MLAAYLLPCDPRLDTVLKLCGALGLELQVGDQNAAELPGKDAPGRVLKGHSGTTSNINAGRTRRASSKSRLSAQKASERQGA